jgi:hypothetical protein
VKDKVIKLPGPDHPITIAAITMRVVVFVAGVTLMFRSRSHARNIGSSHKPACVTNFGFRYASIASLPPSEP